MDWFNKQKEITRSKNERLDIPGDLWLKCPRCKDTVYLKDLERNHNVCECNHHFRISPEERIAIHFDPQSFEEIEATIEAVDFLKFEDTESYERRLKRAKQKTNHADAILIGTAKINHLPVNIGVMDFSFMGGSMGSVVGEKITRIIEHALKNKYPLIIFTSSGGARMQEGIMSLMQMAKTSAALQKLSAARIPYISVLCDPTTGGTSASFAMLGDINMAEPGALISFAGPRVIEQTIRQKLPKGFQRSEFLLEKGMLDMVTHRKDMRVTLGALVKLLNPHYETVTS
ncbi:MAG: acetyl-CoA carboxylase, carboxyltransferase subunit beta [Candidatus Marinamargulisbacteria bacterium]